MSWRPAERALLALGIRDPAEIEVEAVAFDLGAQVREGPLAGCEASIVGFGDRAVIRVDPAIRPERRRFSIAHECGHWVHHRGRAFRCRSADIGDPGRSLTDPERVADSYAADLLMPRFLFAPAAGRAPHVGFALVEELKSAFRTSLLATALRLVDLGPEPSLLICHDPRRRRWFRRARAVPRCWFPKPLLDPDSYAFDLLRGDTRCHGRRGRMPADVWFDHDGVGEREVMEESIAYGESVLSFITFPDEEW